VRDLTSADCESKVPCVPELDTRGPSVRAGLAFPLGMTEKEEARTWLGAAVEHKWGLGGVDEWRKQTIRAGLLEVYSPRPGGA